MHFQLTISVAPAMQEEQEEHTNKVCNWFVCSSNRPIRADGMGEQLTFDNIYSIYNLTCRASESPKRV